MLSLLGITCIVSCGLILLFEDSSFEDLKGKAARVKANITNSFPEVLIIIINYTCSLPCHWGTKSLRKFTVYRC